MDSNRYSGLWKGTQIRRPRVGKFVNLGCRNLNCWNLRLMLKMSHAAVLVYLQPFQRSSLLKCFAQPKIPRKILKIFLWERSPRGPLPNFRMNLWLPESFPKVSKHVDQISSVLRKWELSDFCPHRDISAVCRRTVTVLKCYAACLWICVHKQIVCLWYNQCSSDKMNRTVCLIMAWRS